MIILKKLAKLLIKSQFVQNAILEETTLEAFKEKPSPRIIFGIFLMGFSYLIGWPAISALGILAVYWKEPLIAVIGGPITYGISHLVFMAGLYFAGAEYSIIFFKWATRKAMEKILQDEILDFTSNNASQG